MRSKDALKRLGLSLIACLFFIGTAMGAEKSSVIKLATLAPDGSSWMKTFQALSSEVMKKTDNKVQFKI
jgi:TRAP-type C4-dicarboxylate transport system substrate-binding protein